MARREFSVPDIVGIYLYWQAGEGVRQIARSLGLDRSTTSRLLVDIRSVELEHKGVFYILSFRKNER